jgi:hypothetical protein
MDQTFSEAEHPSSLLKTTFSNIKISVFVDYVAVAVMVLSGIEGEDHGK